ncbi:MAG: porin family protein [Bacteroidaceae bacterium]|nr:porin family protein [Bacteroidaceae bacterium]
MKKLFCLICMGLFIATASAQITWNAKGGLGFANCIGDYETNGKFVAKAGVGIEKAFSPNWSLMPSLELAWKGYDVDDYEYSETADMFYLQIPVLAAYRLNLNDSWNLVLKAGPYIACGLFGNISASFEGTNESDDIFDYAERLDVGLDFGVDFEYHRYVIGAEYEFGLTSLSKEGDVHTSAFYVTVGYKF